MSVSTCNVLAVFITLCVVLQEGFGLPLSGQQPDLLPAPSSSSSSPQRHRLVRTKRCSCNSWLDKECIYFCHLDIIWVNTPSKILPYGFGSPLSRRRRSADDRCQCSNPADPTCSSFCHDSSQNPSIVVAEPSVDAKNHPNTESDLLLASLRSVVKSNMATAHHTASPRKRPSRAARLQYRTRK